VFYAGGGGGVIITNGLPSFGGGGGGGNGGRIFYATGGYIAGQSGLPNTGGGAGGTTYALSGPVLPGASNGGSGIVVIRYPSYLAPATSTTGSPEMIIVGAWRVYTFIASGTITF
jgi:hypothetical protein